MIKIQVDSNSDIGYKGKIGMGGLRNALKQSMSPGERKLVFFIFI
jgi:hypothetical protein